MFTRPNSTGIRMVVLLAAGVILPVHRPARAQQPEGRPAMAYVSISESLVSPNPLISPYYRVYVMNRSNKTITVTVRRRGESLRGEPFVSVTPVTILPGDRVEVGRRPFLSSVRYFFDITSAEYGGSP
jgi:hypothetical protein